MGLECDQGAESKPVGLEDWYQGRSNNKIRPDLGGLATETGWPHEWLSNQVEVRPAPSESGHLMPFRLDNLEDGCWEVNFLGLDAVV